MLVDKSNDNVKAALQHDFFTKKFEVPQPDFHKFDLFVDEHGNQHESEKSNSHENCRIQVLKEDKAFKVTTDISLADCAASQHDFLNQLAKAAEIKTLGKVPKNTVFVKHSEADNIEILLWEDVTRERFAAWYETKLTDLSKAWDIVRMKDEEMREKKKLHSYEEEREMALTRLTDVIQANREVLDRLSDVKDALRKTKDDNLL